MIYTDLNLTFIPIIQTDRYEELNKYMFEGRHVVDLGAGPLDLMYHHSMSFGGASYHAVESNPDYANKLKEKLQGKPAVREIVNMDIQKFVKQFSNNRNSTIVCAGIERRFIKGWKKTTDTLVQQLHRGSRYIGVSSGLFMIDDWIEEGIETYHDKEQFYTFQNGDHILIAQTEPLPTEICVKTKGVSIGSGKPFGKFDGSFEIPNYDIGH